MQPPRLVRLGARCNHDLTERGFHGAGVASIGLGSRRHTVPASRFDNHTDPSPTRIASPPLPANCCTTLFVAGSMRVIGNSNDVTHTEPSPAAMSPPPPGT